MRISSLSLVIAAILLYYSTPVAAQDKSSHEMHKTKSSGMQGQHIIFKAGDEKWSKAPDVLPSGAQMAVLDGDPSQEGLFTIRLKVPSNYRISPHWHPMNERITVIKGEFIMGTGDRFNESNGTVLPTGSYTVMPARMNHFAWSRGETIVQLSGMGPWQLYYVNPNDDPRSSVSKRGGSEQNQSKDNQDSHDQSDDK